MYPGRFKILGDLRSDIPIDDIFPTKKGETSKQTRGANYLREFEEEAFPLGASYMISYKNYIYMFRIIQFCKTF